MAKWKRTKKIIRAVVPHAVIRSIRVAVAKIGKRLIKSGAGSLAAATKTRGPQYIVTLTSYGDRVARSAPYAIYSLLKQSVLPDRIVIWLGEGTEIPRELQELQDKGIEIRFCEDCGPHTKLVPALLAFPDDVLITADDDVSYPRDWFRQLKEAHLKDASSICVHRAREIGVDAEGNILPYAKWRQNVKSTVNAHRLFPTGVGGILYPPGSLDGMATETELFRTLTPTTDDIWFWAMAQIRGTSYAIIDESCLRQTQVIDFESQENALYQTNIVRGQNDIQFNNVLIRFPELSEKIKNVISN